MSDENDNRLPTVDDCILWLDRKYARHNELEDKYAADYLRALRLQLSRARKWMQHGPYCKMRSSMTLEIGRTYTVPKDFDAWRDSQPCTCGLTEFLKEVGEEG